MGIGRIWVGHSTAVLVTSAAFLILATVAAILLLHRHTKNNEAPDTPYAPPPDPLNPDSHDDIHATCRFESGKEQMSSMQTKWLSVGGDGVGNINQDGKMQSKKVCLKTAPGLIAEFGFTGIAFDMEGCLGNTENDVIECANWLDNLKTSNEIKDHVKSILVCGNMPGFAKSTYDRFDYVAPMFYTVANWYNPDGDQSGWRSGCCTAANIHDNITQWDAYVPNNKLFVTYTAQGNQPETHVIDTVQYDWSANFRLILSSLATRVANHGHPGILGWPTVPTDRTATEECETIIDNALTAYGVVDSKLRGGWCQCAPDDNISWGAKSNLIIAGGFAPDGRLGPFCG